MIYRRYISLLFSVQSTLFKGEFRGIYTRFLSKNIQGFRVELTLTVNCQYSTVSCLFGDLVIYDLPDSEGAPKRRTRLHKLLSGYRKWAQYSVFECFLTAVQFVKLQKQVEQLIKHVEDSVRIYVLGAGRREADDYLWFPAT